MPVTYIIRFTIRPDQRDRFIGLLDGVLDAMRTEPMFHEAILHRDPDDENRMLLYETWEDHDDVLQVQVHRPYRAAFHAALDAVLSEPRDISVWVPLRADRRAG